MIFAYLATMLTNDCSVWFSLCRTMSKYCLRSHEIANRVLGPQLAYRLVIFNVKLFGTGVYEGDLLVS
jgi:hypothetical protein